MKKIVVVLLASVIFALPISASAAPGLGIAFGGVLFLPTQICCNGSALIFVAGPKGKGTYLVQIPPKTMLYSYYAFFFPGTFVLGKYTPKPTSCTTAISYCEATVKALGTVTMMGTSGI